MKSIEVSARTIEEAISEGLQKLECSISDCKVEILQEGAKGLFGFFGSKPASVRLTLTSDEDDEIDFHSALDQKAAKPAKQQAPKAEKKPAEKKPAPAPKPKPEAKADKTKMRIASNPQVIDKPEDKADVKERFKSAPLPGSSAPAKDKPKKPAKPRQQAPRSPRDERYEEEARFHAEEQRREPVPAPENIVMHDPATPEGIAQQFLLDVTKRMGVDVQVDLQRGEDGHLFASMYGDTLGILIGRRGETLDALQYLTSLQVNRGRENYTRVTLDTENYRAKREEALVRLAARMANRAVKTGRKVSLEPMNPYERRILHSSLQGNAEVTTHSEGDEPYRHVVVVPVK